MRILYFFLEQGKREKKNKMKLFKENFVKQKYFLILEKKFFGFGKNFSFSEFLEKTFFHFWDFGKNIFWFWNFFYFFFHFQKLHLTFFRFQKILLFLF